jgi:hypothetical protein
VLRQNGPQVETPQCRVLASEGSHGPNLPQSPRVCDPANTLSPGRTAARKVKWPRSLTHVFTHQKTGSTPFTRAVSGNSPLLVLSESQADTDHGIPRKTWMRQVPGMHGDTTAVKATAILTSKGGGTTSNDNMKGQSRTYVDTRNLPEARAVNDKPAAGSLEQ